LQQGDNVVWVVLSEPRSSVVAARAFMPAHGHETGPPAVIGTVDGYRVEDLELFMPGRWEITLHFETDGATDRFVFAADVR
jgi:hypothetical protein